MERIREVAGGIWGSNRARWTIGVMAALVLFWDWPIRTLVDVLGLVTLWFLAGVWAWGGTVRVGSTLWGPRFRGRSSGLRLEVDVEHKPFWRGVRLFRDVEEGSEE